MTTYCQDELKSLLKVKRRKIEAGDEDEEEIKSDGSYKLILSLGKYATLGMYNIRDGQIYNGVKVFVNEAVKFMQLVNTSLKSFDDAVLLKTGGKRRSLNEF